MNQDNPQEIFPLVNPTGRVIGSATRGECHGGSRLLHPVVHLHVFNSDRQLFLQHRPAWKDIQPDKWDTSVGGHINYGEDILSALRREAAEELGISGFIPEKITSYVFENDRERELVNVFLTIYDGPVKPSDELNGGRFWTITEIYEAIESGNLLTPNFAGEFPLVAKFLCERESSNIPLK